MGEAFRGFRSLGDGHKFIGSAYHVQEMTTSGVGVFNLVSLFYPDYNNTAARDEMSFTSFHRGYCIYMSKQVVLQEADHMDRMNG